MFEICKKDLKLLTNPKVHNGVITFSTYDPVTKKFKEDALSFPISAHWNRVLDKPDFADVATTGDYNDLNNIPMSLMSGGGNHVNADWNAIAGPAFILNKPDLSTFQTQQEFDAFVAQLDPSIFLNSFIEVSKLGSSIIVNGKIKQELLPPSNGGIPEGVATEEYVDSSIAALDSNIQSSLNTLDEAISVITSNIEVLDDQIQLRVTQTDFDALGNQVGSLETLITQTASEIALKASQTDVDELTGIVSDHSAQISVMAGQIELLVSSTEFDQFNQLLQQLQTSINQNASEIALKADKTVVDQLTGEVSTFQAQLSIQADQIATKVSQSDFDTLDGTVTGLQTTITQQADQIELKADKTTVNDLEGRVTDAEAAITLTADQIELKANQTSVDQLTGEVSTLNSQLTIQAGQIATKVSQSDFDTLEGRVSGAETTITQLPNLIALKADKTVTDSLSETITDMSAQLTIQADEIATKVSQTTFNNLSGNVSDLEGRVTSAETTITQTANGLTLKADKSIVDGLGETVSENSAQLVILSDEISTKVSQTEFDSFGIAFSEAETNITQLENSINLKANISTVNTLTGRVTAAEGSITTQAGQIALKANQTTVDTVTGRVSSAESAIIQNANNIALKVSTTDFTGANMISRINLAPGGVTIDGAKVNINGLVTFSSFNPALQSSYNALNSKTDSVYNYVTTTLPGIIGDIEAQLDGVVEQYFYTTDPSNGSVPTSDWITAGEQADHAGDLYYNTDTGQSWRYVLEGGVYLWKEIINADLQAALAAAAAAQDTADGKRRIFTVQPFPPYDMGDLWVQGPGGDIMRCITARASGSYTAGDWEKASKYTDDTVANSVLARLNAWADDGTWSPAEVTQIRLMYAQEIYFMSTVHATSIIYDNPDLSTARGELFDIWNIVNAQLIYIIQYSGENVPVDPAFITDIQIYYEKKEAFKLELEEAKRTFIDVEVAGVSTDLNNHIATLKYFATQDWDTLSLNGQTFIQGGKINTVLLDAAAIRATIIDAAYINTLALNASVIQSGIIDSNRINANQILINAGGATVNDLVYLEQRITTSDAIGSFRLGGSNLLLLSGVSKTSSTTTIGEYTLSEPLSQGEQVTISIWGALGNQRFGFKIYNSNTGVELTTVASTISDGAYRKTFNWTIGGSTNDKIIVTHYGLSGSSTIARIKLERGTKGTDWQESPYDKVELAKLGTTIIQGGYLKNEIINTNTLIVRDGVGNSIGTLIDGGYIRTSLINANQIIVNGNGATKSELAAITVGGTNLLTKTQSLANNAFPGNNTSTNYNGFIVAKITGQTGVQKDTFMQITPILNELEYTISFFAKTDEAEPLTITNYFFAPDTTTHYKTTSDWVTCPINGACNIIIDNQWKRYSISWRQSISGSSKSILLGRLSSGAINNGRTVSIAGVKFERGNRASDWSPSPNDYGALAYENQVELARLGTTIIDGGFIKSQLINAPLIVSQGGGVTQTTVNTTVSNALATINVGGTNLLLNSGTLITNANYNIAQYGLTETIANSSEMTITIWGTLGSDRNQWLIYNTGANQQMTIMDSSNQVSPGVYRKTFGWTIGSSSNTNLFVWQAPSNGTSASTITKIKLEKGNKGTDWSPSPEDKVELAKLGTTIIQGGLIKTDLLDTRGIQIKDLAGNVIFSASQELDGLYVKNLRADTITIGNIAAGRMDAFVIDAINNNTIKQINAARINTASLVVDSSQVAGLTPLIDNKVEEKVNTVKVATRNLIRNSFSGIYSTRAYWSINVGGQFDIQPSGTTNGGVDVSNSLWYRTSAQGNGIYGGGRTQAWKPNTDYVIQFEAKSENLTVSNRIYIGPELIPIANITVTLISDNSKWHTYTVKFKTGSSDSGSFVIYQLDGGIRSFFIRNVFVGEGNAVAGYSDAPEAINEKIQSNLDTSMTALSTNLTNSFSDNIVTTSEAAALRQSLNALEVTIVEAYSSYNTVYNNSSLIGTPKQELFDARNTLNSAFITLKNAINTAIADGKVTGNEGAVIPALYDSFRQALTAFTEKLEIAYNSITTQIIDVELGDIQGQIDKFSQDSVLTSLEKKGLRVIMDSIIQEYPKRVAAAQQYGVPFGAYTTAYDALYNLVWPLVQDSALNTDTTGLNRGDFNLKFKNYATQLETLNQTIEITAKGAVDAKTTVFNYISTVYKVGDLMILPNDQTQNGVTVCGGNIPESRTYKGGQVYRAANSRNCHQASDWIALDYATSQQITTAINNNNAVIASTYTNQSTFLAEMGVRTKVFTTTPSNYKIGDMWIPTANTVIGSTTFALGKAYLANTTNAGAAQESHWASTIPVGEANLAPMQYLLDALKAGSTVITNGLILSNVMALRDSSSQIVTSYMSGQKSSNPTAFAAGVSNFASSGSGGGETKMIDLRHDGSGHLAGGKITWTNLGTLNIEGNLTAGTVGTWTLNSNGLIKTTVGGIASYATTNLSSIGKLDLYNQQPQPMNPTGVERAFMKYDSGERNGVQGTGGLTIYNDFRFSGAYKTGLTISVQSVILNRFNSNIRRTAGSWYDGTAFGGENIFISDNFTQTGYDLALNIPKGHIYFGDVQHIKSDIIDESLFSIDMPDPVSNASNIVGPRTKGRVRWAKMMDSEGKWRRALVLDGLDLPFEACADCGTKL